MRYVVTSLCACSLALVLSGCGDSSGDKKPVAFPNAAPKDPAKAKPKTPPADMAGRMEVGDFSVAVPPTWKGEKPSNQMRLWQAIIPKSEGDTQDAQLTVFSLGGSVDENIKRWTDQQFVTKNMEPVRTQLKTASGDPATIVEAGGTYAGMGSNGEQQSPQANHKMLGGIIVSGASQFQFKLTGPAKTVDVNKDAFVKMIESFQ
jgi:hypothetical protein